MNGDEMTDTADTSQASTNGAPDGVELVHVAEQVARAAGAVLLDHQDRVLTVDTKTSATDPVSEADRASEQLISAQLLELRPDDGLLGEEGQANCRGTTGLRWVVDPLDATVNYLYGLPHWCVSIAVQDATGQGHAGVVYDPVKDECFRAWLGGGAWLGNQRLQVNDPPSLDRALLATGFSYDAKVRRDQGRDTAVLLSMVRDIRRCGSAALDLAYVAAGRVDAYLEFGLFRWDWAAGKLLVTEAGGEVRDRRRQLGAEEPLEGLVAGSPGTVASLSFLLDRLPE